MQGRVRQNPGLSLLQLQVGTSLELFSKDLSSPMFRYVTINGRADNCLLSSQETPGQNVGYHHSSPISAHEPENVLLDPEHPEIIKVDGCFKRALYNLIGDCTIFVIFSRKQ